MHLVQNGSILGKSLKKSATWQEKYDFADGYMPCSGNIRAAVQAIYHVDYMSMGAWKSDKNTVHIIHCFLPLSNFCLSFNGMYITLFLFQVTTRWFLMRHQLTCSIRAQHSTMTASISGMGDTPKYLYPSATTPVCNAHQSHPHHPKTITFHHLA